jgi:predicted HTH domain antitoxin
MTAITIPVSESLMASVNQSLTEMAATMKRQYAAKMFQEGKITLAQGAEFCGVAFTDFMFMLSDMGVALIDYAPEELDRELACMEARL